MIENLMSEFNSLKIILFPLFQTAFATSVIEVLFWYFCKFKSLKFLTLIVLINLMSNIFANFVFLYIPQNAINIFITELFIVIFECLCIKITFKKYCFKRLLKLTFFANLISFSLGVLYFSIFK